MNLTRLRRDYGILSCKGAEDALLAMAPEWSPAPKAQQETLPG
jgi:hypothetical protein